MHLLNKKLTLNLALQVSTYLPLKTNSRIAFYEQVVQVSSTTGRRIVQSI